MTVTLRFFGVEILHVSTDSPTPEPDDTARDLSGGTLTTERIDAGPTDCYMGFTNGRGDDEWAP